MTRNRALSALHCGQLAPHISLRVLHRLRISWVVRRARRAYGSRRHYCVDTSASERPVRVRIGDQETPPSVRSRKSTRRGERTKLQGTWLKKYLRPGDRGEGVNYPVGQFRGSISAAGRPSSWGSFHSRTSLSLREASTFEKPRSTFERRRSFFEKQRSVFERQVLFSYLGCTATREKDIYVCKYAIEEGRYRYVA